jgi:hypothetical protein
MTLLNSHPYRFGWRLWFVLPRIARLITTVEAVMLPGHTLDATCELGHTPPVLACTCGVHYWPDIGITDEHNHTGPLLALTFGVALGPITPDRTDPDALRSRRHRILAMFLPASLERRSERFSQQHGVPVFADISEARCRAAANAAVANRGPDWLAVLDAEATPRPDDATQRYNATITSVRRTRRPLDANLLAQIETTFTDSHRVDELVGGLA